MQESKTLHYILGAALVMIAVFALSAFLMVNSQAATPLTSVAISNALPTASALVLNTSAGASTANEFDSTTGFIPNINSTKTIYAKGTITDPNGFADIVSVQIDFYRTNGVGAGSANGVSQYQTLACNTFDTLAGNTVHFVCPIVVQYYAASTQGTFQSFADTWTITATPKDTVAAGTAATDATREITATAGLLIPGPIGFGTMAVSTATIAGTSTNTAGANGHSIIQTFTQQSNAKQGVVVVFGTSGADTTLTCTSGTTSIGMAGLQWNLTPDLAFGGTGSHSVDTYATAAASATAAIGVLPMTTSTPTTANLYWAISIPTGVGGTCSATITETAITSA